VPTCVGLRYGRIEAPTRIFVTPRSCGSLCPKAPLLSFIRRTWSTNPTTHPRAQYGGCSTGLQHPDRYLGRLRTISRLHVYLVCDQKPAKQASLHRLPSARLHQCGIARLCGEAERISAEQQGGAKVSLHRYLALEGIYLPIRTILPNSPTLKRVNTNEFILGKPTGLSPSLAQHSS
jgi:hypothetical protein